MSTDLATYRERLRGTITTGSIGTPGSGLKGPDQFDAWFKLAANSTDFLNRMRLHAADAKSGELPRFDFVGDNFVEGGVEGADSGNYFSPTHDGIPFSLQNAVMKARLSKKSIRYVTGDRYQDELNERASQAFWRSVLRTLWLGDTASSDPSLRFVNGWAKKIAASGVVVAATAASAGTDFAIEHLHLMKQSLAGRFASDAGQYEFVMSQRNLDLLMEELDNRVAGQGNQTHTILPDGRDAILRRPVNVVDAVGNASVFMVKPKELICVADTTDWSLETITGGQLAVDGVVVLKGDIDIDPIVAEVEGAVVLTGLV